MDLLFTSFDFLSQLLVALNVSAAIGALVLIAAVPLLSDRSFALVQFGLFVVPLTQYAGGWSDGIRGLTIVLAAVRLALTGRFSKTRYRASMGGWVRLLSISTILFALSSGWSVAPSETLTASIGLLSTIAVLWSTSADEETARWASRCIIAVLIVSSLFILPLDEAWAAGRLRGVMTNANGLAVFLVLGCLISRASRHLRVTKFLICVTLLFLTGSRAGVLSLAVGLVALAIAEWRRGNVTQRGIAIAVAGSGALTLVMLTVPFERLPWRMKDTRADVWERSYGFVQDHLLLGVGAGALPVESGSSYLRILAELGLVGSMACLFALVSRFHLRSLDAVQVAIVGAMAVHMFFEGWFLVGGSAIFLVVIAQTVAIDNRTFADRRRRSSNVPDGTHANSGLTPSAHRM